MVNDISVYKFQGYTGDV